MGVLCVGMMVGVVVGFVGGGVVCRDGGGGSWDCWWGCCM